MAQLLCKINKVKHRSVKNLLIFLTINVLISIKGHQCDSVAEESQFSTYRSTFKFLPPKVNGENKENVLKRSSLPTKLSHPVILSPYRFLSIYSFLIFEHVLV